jgi:hypothetical protein
MHCWSIVIAAVLLDRTLCNPHMHSHIANMLAQFQHQEHLAHTYTSYAWSSVCITVQASGLNTCCCCLPVCLHACPAQLTCRSLFA